MQLNKDSAYKFLAALGRDPRHVRLRGFPPSSTPAEVKRQLKETKCDSRKFAFGDWTSAEWCETMGFGIYAVINPGGDTAASITECIAYFHEFDTIPKEQQVQIVSEKLPQPSIIVDTGGNSLHFYWVLKQPITDKAQWKQDQQRTAKYLGSDRSICDASRVMRLPGSIYFDGQRKPIGMARMVSISSATYTREQFMEYVPEEPTPPAPTTPRVIQTVSTDQTVQQALEQLARIPPRVPGSGTRSDYLRLLWSLAALVGPEEAGRLFSEHSPAWAAAEDLTQKAGEAEGQIGVNTFFQIARDAFGITRPTRRSRKVKQSAPKNTPFNTEQSLPTSDVPALAQARVRLAELISDGLSGSALASAIGELSAEYDCYPSTLNSIAAELQKETDAGLQAEAELREINRARELEEERKTFTLERLVPAQCVEPLRYLSTSLQADDLAAAMTFLTVMSGAVKAGTRIWGDELTFAERPQIWLALVGKSGLGKSPVIRNLGIALAAKILKYYTDRNVQRYTQWEVTNAALPAARRPPPPDPYVFQLDSYTGSALVKQFSANEPEALGMILYVDELAGLFASLNQYTSGKGDEEQQLLSLFDNNGGAQIRVKEGYRHYTEGQLSIIGGFQPLVFDQLASRGDPAGLFARILLLPLPTDYRGDQQPPGACWDKTTAMQDTLENIMFEAFYLDPALYRLDREAQEEFRRIKREAFELAARAMLPAHSNIYGKRAGYVLRIAGVLQILSVACGECGQMDEIGIQRLSLARDIVCHLQAYALSAQSRVAQLQEGGLCEMLHMLHRYALDKPGSPGRFRANYLTPKKRKDYSMEAIVRYVDQLVEAGCARWMTQTKNGGRSFITFGRLPV